MISPTQAFRTEIRNRTSSRVAIQRHLAAIPRPDRMPHGVFHAEPTPFFALEPHLEMIAEQKPYPSMGTGTANEPRPIEPTFYDITPYQEPDSVSSLFWLAGIGGDAYIYTYGGGPGEGYPRVSLHTSYVSAGAVFLSKLGDMVLLVSCRARGEGRYEQYITKLIMYYWSGTLCPSATHP